MAFTADQVEKMSVVGTHADGKGLYLQVAANGTKSWLYRYQLAGRRRNMGLGGYPAITLSQARKTKNNFQLQVKAGSDPLEEKRKSKEKGVAEHREQGSSLMTFSRCSEEYIAAKRSGWKSSKHAQQWENTLATYAAPFIGDMPVKQIEGEHVLEILQPIWFGKTETANRVRNRIELILDYATTLKHRSGDNPARWRGNLSNLLPSPSKVKEVRHHSALPYEDMPEFMAKLFSAKGFGAQALILTILTATRTSETLQAIWGEFDLEEEVWTIPKSRMKAGKEHRIPLSKPAVALLKKLGPSEASVYVFPGAKVNSHLSNMSMTTVLRRMKRGDVTVQGFRSTFRDWAVEKTNYPDRLAEKALSHSLKSESEAAYQRGQLLEKRAAMMDAWSRYCFPEKAKVAKIKIRIKNLPSGK